MRCRAATLLAESVEAAALAVVRDAQPNRALATNFEFYTALLVRRVVFAPADFTGVFAMDAPRVGSGTPWNSTRPAG